MEKLFYAGLLAAALAGSYGLAYKYGQFVGTVETATEWKKENERRDDAYALLEKKNAAQLAAHQEREQELGDNLREIHEQAESALSSARADFAHRLQLAEGRAGVYLRQAQGSASEQARLARHAAELDRTVEEGRALVRELGETVRQRDRTIIALGQVILNDRTLFTGEPNGL